MSLVVEPPSVARALARAARDQLQPRMLALLVLPLLVSVVLWVALGAAFWAPALAWLTQWVEGGWLATRVGAERLAMSIAVLALLPLLFATALLVSGIVAMPAVLRFLGARGHGDVERRAGAFEPGALASSAWVNFKSFALFVPGYLLTVPLWLIPPLVLVVPWLWWGWLTASVLRHDSLADHATPAERAMLLRKHRGAYLLLGLAVAALNWIPPLFLVAPVFGALAFGHYSLDALRALRAQPQAIA